MTNISIIIIPVRFHFGPTVFTSIFPRIRGTTTNKHTANYRNNKKKAD